MPVRIYALAKELNLDSKDLVEIVKKVGLTGKGSALASLTDDEAVKVREHLSGGGASAGKKAPAAKAALADSSPAAPVAAVRDAVVPSGRRPITIRGGRGATERRNDAAATSGDVTTADAPTETGADEVQVSETPTAEKAPVPAMPAEPPATPPPAMPPLESKAAASGADDASAKDRSDQAERPVPKMPKSGPLSRGPLSKDASPSRPIPRMPAKSGKPAGQPSAPATPPKTEKKAAPAAPAAKSGDTSMAERIASRMGSTGNRVVPNRPGQPVAPVRGQMGAGNRVRSLDRPRRGGGEGDANVKGGGDAGKGKKREPKIKINLAQLPDAPAPAEKPAASGPAAQKPDIKLSKDLIAGHKKGMSAPLQKLESEEKERTAAKRGGGGLKGFSGRKKGAEEEEERPGRKKGSLAGMASARAERVRGGGGRRNLGSGDYRGGRRSPGNFRKTTLKRKGTNTAAPRKEKVTLELPCTLRSFCEAAGVPVAQVLRVLMGMQMMVNINSEIDLETAELLATELDLDIQLKETETLEEEVITQLEETEDDPESLVARPPIVTFLGHVDHGKTSLLDYLIGIDVVSGEAGGITQHIRAYQIDKDGQPITFVDTPGHEAFTEMRARGANVTDIAVLVIAADDGIMPQTEEAISHAKAAEVPIVVALNKIDLEGVDPNRVMTQLTEHQLTPSEWGGDVEVVPTSAIKGTGMDTLLDTLLTVSELHEFTANPNRQALGVCLEAEQHGDKGVISKLVVQNGTLKVGDIIVCGPAHGRVRAMTDPLTGKPITEAGPSTPVSLTGLDQPPGAGDRFHVLDDISKAREIASQRAESSSRQSLSGITTKVSFENFQEMLMEGKLGSLEDKVKLNIIVRADVKGSLEAIDKELSKFDHPEVEIRVLQRSVGGITLADVTLASASDAVIIGFNVIPDEQARSMADERGVEIRRYDVIYKLTDDIKAMIEGRLKPEERVVELGRALVKQTFSISRVGTIAGCYVAQGVIERGCRIRVNRDGRTIGDYALDTLRRVKEDVKEVPRGMECGIRLANFNDVKQDDVLEAYKIEEVARTLD
ncbi:translation initiation factor IF-2 [Crateriforma conspicua]|uniref:translation initiation factor IF-2 n=1 Tax=Crateriforma conspicua TaxID=2527996 RepID=UPI001187993E|nr:translation initiation factor IF-2 [Crateriforma conspicua]QDV62780.1 Translation initiation factor IF-2 [Crateriforma conspicua]